MKRLAIISVLTCVSLFMFSIADLHQQRVQADAASTGKSIGTGISAAISAAFPGIQTILNAIWPKGTEASKQKKSDATTATKDLQTKSTQGLSQIDKVTADLDTVTLFLANCVVAENKVIAMRTMIEGKATLSPQDTLKLQDQWNTAKGRLANLKGAGNQVAKMNDASVQAALQAIVDTSAGPTDSISQEVTAGTPALALLSSNLAQLDQQLSTVNALSGQVILNVSSGLKTAKTTAAGGLGAPALSESLAKANSTFADAMTQQYHLQ